MSAAGGDIESVVQAIVRARGAKGQARAADLAAGVRTPEDAYHVQRRVRETLEPGRIRYWKSGGPSRTATLTHAPLFSSGVHPSHADLSPQHFNFRLIEAELALTLGEDVSSSRAATLTREGAGRLVQSMAVSIEIVDSRWVEGLQAPALLKLADLQSHGALVLGAQRPFEQRDWLRQECTVQIGAAATQVHRGTHPLADPTWLLASWLQHVTRDGSVAPAGTVVTTGTWCGMLPAAAGDTVRVSFDGIGEASVQL